MAWQFTIEVSHEFYAPTPIPILIIPSAKKPEIFMRSRYANIPAMPSSYNPLHRNKG